MTRASGDGSLIAVVGISCRLPRAPDPQAYWQLLRSGRDAISELPRERLELAGEDGDSALEEERGTRLGGFLEGVDRFDPAFFGISPREAAAMDPQQRLALELAWEALEDAGIAPSAIRGAAAGVFLGAIAGDYASLADRRGPEAIDRYTATGLYRSIIANRISYVLGLGGPSLTVDAAQSASLVAVHLACESLRRGESKLALAGGVHLNLDPRGALGAARIGGLSPDGRCFTFDARANGFVRGEGGGIVVLKPLADARADGDCVYCVVRGSAVNNDGGGAGLTAPSQAAQEAVIRAACRRAGVKRSELQYVELHGSATPTGDPIEAAALGGALGREADAPLSVGSAKTNIGHLEGAAGIAGLIKVALAIDRRQIPASLNFERPNPAIPLDELGLRVQGRLEDWPRDDRPLLAGVSSFGVGGTNCHVVLSEVLPGNQRKSTKPKNGSDEEAPPLPGATPLLLSAASPAALRAQAERLKSRLEQSPQLDLADVGYSLATARSHLRRRAAIMAPDRRRLLDSLGSLVAASEDDSVLSGDAGAACSPVFLFPGQGSQWVGMGVELAAASPVFRGYLEECEAALAPHIDFALIDALNGSGGAASLDRVDVIQPALFAVMVSLARFWGRCGVTPAAVVGHSQGEVAAACIAGGLSLEDAALISAVRSRLIQERAGEGGMVSVALSGRSLEPLLEPFGDRLAVAAQNGPAAAIVSGERRALDQLLEICAARDVRARDLAGGIFASHSAYVEPMREELIAALAGISPRSGEIPFHSTVSGGLLDTAELDADYWYRNLRLPVRFEQVTRQLLDQGRRLFVEISAHPVFAVAVEGTIEDTLDDPEEATVLATLRRDQGGPERFARSLAEAHVAGVVVEWERHFDAAERVKLPTYPFQRRRCWLGDAGLAAEPAELPAAQQPDRVLALVRGEVAKVLGQGSADSVAPDRAFKDLGFDSAAAADLRKRLRAASGLRIGSTAVFDHPTSHRLARHLLALATGEAGDGGKVTVGARSPDEPIAIVGMACRLPGARSPGTLWRLLSEGLDATSELPDDRGWERERLYDPAARRPDTTYVWRGGFLADAGDFDAGFFDVSPREATAMDPQQRLLLEASWEACEGAGLVADGLRGSRTGVFTGISSQDYSAGLRGSGDAVEGYRLTGSATSVASGRVSYALGLEGPAITVDTACSSSLVAMHLAAGALRGGECDLALAGGATVLGSLGAFTEFSRQRGLAPDGRCKAFAEAADGTAWAEGVGVLVLERLSDAEANGHRVFATIKGSAVNQDGASNGLTAPNGPAQERVIRQALANAGLKPSDVDLVEAHGTGTALGDPIEAGALLATYGQERETPIKLGSLKSNIGHAQAAAGVAGVIKAVMAMREGVMPKTLHLDAPSSKVEWGSGKVELLAEPVPWPETERPRRAAVSSFGISGTNAHLILEEAPVAGRDPGPGASAKDLEGEQGASPAPLGGPLPFTLSAKSPEALAAQAERLAGHLKDNPEQSPVDVACSLATTRARLDHRAVLVAEEQGELLAALGALAQGESSAGTFSGKAVPGARLAFLLTGQGSQRPGMGKELHRTYPAYTAAFDAACAEIDPLIDRSLKELIFCEQGSEEAELLAHTTFAQPALFALQVALHRLLESFGLSPELLVGHSVGEIAAAHISGVFSLADAAKLVCARGALMGALPSGGAMAAIEATEDEVLASLEGKEEKLSLAAINSPSSCVASGSEQAIEQLRAHWQDRGRKTKRLEVSHAFHSPLMEPMLEEFEQVAKSLSYAEPRTPIVSCLTGELLGAEQAADPAYWVAHVREPVRFADAVGTLAKEGATVFTELGPDPVLCAMARECLEAEEPEPALAPTLRRGRGEPETLIGALSQAHVSGAQLDWGAFFGSGAKTVELPTYPFQRKRYWLSPASGSAEAAALGQRPLEHPFLAAAIEEPEGEGVAFAGRVSLAEHPWLSDHAVLGSVIFPATAFLELALFAGAETGAPTVQELTLQAPLALSEETAVALRVSLSAPDQDGRREIAIHSRPETEDGEWTRNATGVLGAELLAAPEPLPQWPPLGAEQLEPEDLHARLAEAGFEYGAAFRGLTAAWREGEDLYAEVSLPDAQAEGAAGFAMHPALLDGALHPIALAAGEGVRLPFSWSGASLLGGGARELRVRISGGEEGLELAIADGEGRQLGRASLSLREVDPARLNLARQGSDDLLVVEWRQVEPAAAGGGPAERFELLPLATIDRAEAARELCTRLLRRVQEWLEQSEEGSLAILSRGAVATGATETADPALAAAWGLARSAQSEHPGRFLLLDSDGSEASERALDDALSAQGEPQLALREGALLAPRLGAPSELVPPLAPWRLGLLAGSEGTLDGLSLLHDPGAERPLAPSEVRIEMRAAGLNFRDVLIALGLYPGEATLGSEGAGVVTEVGSRVADLAPGDRVMGLIGDAFAPLAIAERALLVPLPEDWSFAQGAAVPSVFLTAFHALVDLAELKAGEKVLVHAGAGGVGMAAIGLAQHLGAEVFATAGPSKWHVLRGLGLADDRIASSRGPGFEQKLLEATGGKGVDVVLNSLAGEFVESSLGLLAGGGRFLEMGKTDIRDPGEVAESHPGVTYRAFDLTEVGEARTGEMLAEVRELLVREELRHSPITSWDLRQAPEAFRHLREGRNVGKVVLAPSLPLDPERTVLITGATGGLGALIAKHLVEAHGARRLLLVSRSGEAAPGALDLRALLEESGAEVRIAACDVSDRGRLEELLGQIPKEHPLGAVVHCAAVLDDGLIESLDSERLQGVFAPKADAAWHLHELTAGLDLSHFVLFSSIAGLLGSPGQAAYAAANAFLDGLAAKRRTEGLAATSIAWGLWATESGMASSLGEADMARLRRTGIEALSEAEGLALLDQALAGSRPLAAAVHLDRAALRAQAAAGALPALLAELAPRPPARHPVSSLAARLDAVPEAERGTEVLDLVRVEVAAVLGHGSADAVDPDKAFKELGFDSLAAVELRNRLKSSTGLRLASTVTFDHPSAASLAAHLLGEMTGAGRVKRAVARAARASEEPIAIVGIGCRLPGGVDSPEQLWELVAEGRDAIVPFPADRGWDLERIYDPDPAHAGTSYVREGGFLADPAAFDAEFFGIAPREAIAMDPQQRLLLETSWEALEYAEIDPRELKGEPAGVFAGAAKGDYSSAVEGYKMIGGLASVLAGRVSYTLGLEGPALSVDTACSSSLVAMHLAIAALHRGECSLALAGGVTVHATPAMFVDFSRQRVLAPDGRSKSFGEAADGAGWSEGAGMLVLERLSAAERNGRRVLATIRGSAVNQDGASNGLSAPNGPAQERVIRQALANAGLDPADVDAVEAHGTGTALGDPLEAGALIATYGRERERPLKLGSIKSNIGHTLGAAGVAGVIKMTMAMRAGVLPRTLHADTPSPAIEWDSAGVELLTEAAAWEPAGRPRRAAVSSFGISGTNAHLILEEAPAAAAAGQPPGVAGAGGSAGSQPLPDTVPLVLSAKTEPALRAGAERLASHLRKNPGLGLADAAYSLASRGAPFEHRAVAVADSREEALEALDSLAGGAVQSPWIARGAARDSKVAFLFPGQGSQWQGMALELLDSSPVFARSMGECEEALAPHLDFVLHDVLEGVAAAPSIERIEVVQPALFAVMVSLAQLWRACGVAPAAAAGHSQGEIAAAHVAGGLSLEDAARLAAVRSRLISKLAGKGGMVSLIVPRERVESLTEPWRGEIEVAAHNGPSSTIVSGTREALDGLLARCEGEEGVRAREVPAAIASHSHHVEELRDEVLEAFAGLSPRSGSIPFHSTVTGGPLDTAELDAEYWYRNLRQPVQFERVARGLIEAGHGSLIEVSPHPVFTLAVSETIEAASAEHGRATVIETLRREEGGARRFAMSLAQAHASGAPVDWDAFFAGSGATTVVLPTYPFQRRRYWLAPPDASTDPAALGQRALEHPFLAAAIEEPEGEGVAFSGRVSVAEHPWLADHAVLGTAILPGTAFLELALFAGRQLDAPTVAELTLQAPLPLAEAAVALRVSVAAPDQAGRREITIHSRPEGDEAASWTRNASGLLAADAPAAPDPLPQWPPAGAEPLEPADLHARLAEAGFEYGAAFQGLTAAWRDGEAAYAEVSTPAGLVDGAGGFALHPALLDAALHPIALGAGEGVRLPFSWSGVALLPADGPGELRVKLSGSAEEGACIELFDGIGTPLGRVASVATRALDPELIRGGIKAPLYGLDWRKPAGSRGSLPAAELWRAPQPDPGAAGAAETTVTALEKIQQWLAGEPEDSRLAILTQGAVATREDESADPARAALWGLVRSAASEHPGRFCLIDSDGSEASEAALERALAADPRETQLALREGELLVPRLTAIKDEPEAEPAELDPERTVLITGATGGLGTLVAKHLVEAHGARRLLLVSRSGEWARGAAGLHVDLEDLGAEVRIAACDVSDRGRLEELLDSISTKHPLGAVIHCAAVLDDGLIESLDRERLQGVFAPKADAAWHLHELTAGLDLSHFVLFSSIAGLLGSPGQANYAAANCFLDGLAARRHEVGLPATSIAWGLWEREDGVASKFGEADVERMRRVGIRELSAEQGLALLDRALAAHRPLAAAVRFDRAALRAQAGAAGLPALLEGMVGPRARAGSAATGAFSRLLREAPEGARAHLAEDFVRAEVAAILGHASAAAVGPGDAFKDLGFDSLAAVELRNRLGAATGLQLPATVVFDYPDAEALSRKVLAEISGAAAAPPAPAQARSSAEPIAIVGMACRLPGGVSSPAGLWRLVDEGRDAIAGLPADRGWDPASIYALDPGRPEVQYLREGGFLADAADFDPGFFSISPREAVSIDPQQRLALESSWEALEDAGIDPHRLRGSSTGVFAGVMHHDYGIAVDDSSGMAAGAASGRVSYALGLEGPAITVDTACSSSLVAMHLAAGALRGGECDLALAGGSTVLATPAVFGYFSGQQGLAQDGRCKAFAEAADGAGFSEGVGLLVLERLSDAEANGHRVLATIKGSAVNQDGASNGLTAPNGPAQERVIRQALANAGLKPSDVDLVEAHGTGTALGDPIEAGALLATYGQERETPIKLGSLKSNIGHAQAAAGVAGVIKAVMAMREGVMPKTLHLDAPSSKVEWGSGKVELLSEATEWEVDGRPRRAAVSSFGASGTNAHLILEEAPVAGRDPGPGASAKDLEGEQGASPAPLGGPLPFTLSAKSPEALAAQAERLAGHLKDNPEQSPVDVACSLATTRARLDHRAVLVAEEQGELLAALGALAQGESSAGTFSGKAVPGARLAFLLTGQGSQRPGMGKELHRTYPAYTAAFDAACAEIDPLIDRSLKELIFCEPGSPESELLAHTTFAQPALFALQVALHRLLESFGLSPELLVGHSVGEIAAAHISGVFSLADAAKLVCARGALMGALPSGGAMAAIEATEDEVLASLEGKEEKLSLAAINSPSSCVASGSEQAIEQLRAHWQDRGRKTKRLEVSHAFHSPLMEPMLEEFEQVAKSLSYAEPRTPIVSCLTGELLGAEQAADPAYWVAHVREPVRFADAVGTLAKEGATVFTELGPDPVLCAMARECLEAEEPEPALAPTLRRGRGEPETLIGALSQAHVSGAQLDWGAFFGSGAKTVELPTYPFQRKRYWLSPASGSAEAAALGQRPLEHPFLAAAIEEPEGEGVAFAGRVSLAEHPWLSDHAVLGSVIFPATAFLELALFAGAETGAPTVQELTLQAPLALSEETAVALRVSLSAPDQDGRREIAIHSRPETEDGEWTRNATGVLGAELLAAPEPLPQWPPLGAEQLEPEDLHARLAEAGFEYGAAFRGLTAAWREGEDLYAEVSLPDAQAEGAAGFAMHPALLDGALHPIALAAGEGVRLPFSWSGASLLGGGARELRVRISGGEEGASLGLFDALGTPIGAVESLVARPLDPEQMRPVTSARLFELSWQKPAASHAAHPLARSWRAPRSGQGAQAAREAILATLEQLQQWLAGEPEDSRLAILTQGAAATSEDEAPDPAVAALWGLVRSAASEHPGRFCLIDSDGSEASEAALEQALAADPRETQLALREGELLAPRLTTAKDEGEAEPAPLDPERTVLITGATGGLGALIAKHLVEAHGARHMLLASRSGEEAPGALDLRALLEESGAEVRIAACDVSDRGQLEELLGQIPKEHPLGAVVHCAAVLDDGLIESLDRERLQGVFAPKADAAWHLHELTAGLDLSHFVLFSSIAGLLGSPGQANYAAANCFLDALAAQRYEVGLPATSIAWGLWAREGGMASKLGEAEIARMRRVGIRELSEVEGLALFDRALAGPRPLAAAVGFDRAALRARAVAGALPALLGGIVPVSRKASAATTGAFSRRLREAPEGARAHLAEDFVRAEVAAILGHASAAAVGPNDAFKDLGLDSLAAIELRNRLGAAIDRRLAASVVFDYPTAAALAAHLLAEAGDGGPTAAPDLSRLEGELAGLPADDPARAELAIRLRALAAELDGEGRTDGESVADRLEGASDQELLDFIDTQVGSSRG